MPAVDISLRTSTKTALFPAKNAVIVSRIWGTSSGFPDAPTNVGAVLGDSQATISWTKSPDLATAPVTSYLITCEGGGLTRSASSSASSIIFTGLTNGTYYTFVVQAINRFGASAGSTPTTPAAFGASGIITLTGASSTSPTQVTLTFSTPPGLSVDAYDPNRWAITGVGSLSLPVYAVSVVGSTVVLETGLQLGGEVYTVTCPNGIVNAATGAPQTSPFSQTFTGQGGTPVVVMARSVDATKLEVIFSMPVLTSDALDTANYTISPTLSVTAVKQISAVLFQLTTSRQLVGTSYGVTVSGIRQGP